jgi:hypothetical protein
METLPDACTIATAVKPCQLNGISVDCSDSINVSKALYTLCMCLSGLDIVPAAAMHKLLQSISTTSMP